MRYLSVCSGIEAATAAWHDLGFEPVAFSEIEPFPSAVLAHHYPNVPNWGDMTRYKEWPNAQIDILVGGTPCQSFSVAGLRKGLDDPRGSLMLTFLGIAERYRPRYIVWENVPGVLSSNGGRDFGSFLGALGNLGYGWAYRVLDAQWFGVAQRRRRVFVVASLGDQRRAAQVLFEREGVCRDPAPSRAAGERPAPSPASRTRGGGGLGTDAELDGGLIASTGNISHCLNAGGMGRQDYETETLVAHAPRAEDGTPLVPVAFAQNSRDEVRLQNGDGQIVGALAAESGMKQTTYVAFAQNQLGEVRTGEVLNTLNTNSNASGRNTPMVAVPVGITLHGTDGTQSVASFTELSSSLRARTPSGVENSTTTAVLQAVPVATIYQDSEYGVAEYPTAGSLRAGRIPEHQMTLAWSIMPQNSGRDYKARSVDVLQPLMAMGPQPSTNQGGDIIQQAMQVRRLTPRECERLQGFPDDYTAIPWRGRAALDCPDGPRYKALGNSMAVPCMRWIGTRIKE